MPVETTPQHTEAEIANYGGWQEEARPTLSAEQAQQAESTPLLDEENFITPDKIRQERPVWMKGAPRIFVVGSSVTGVLYATYALFGLWGSPEEKPSPTLESMSAATIDQEASARISQLQLENENLRRQQFLEKDAPAPAAQPQKAKSKTPAKPKKPKPVTTTRSASTPVAVPRRSSPLPPVNPTSITQPTRPTTSSPKPSTKADEPQQSPADKWLAATNTGVFGSVSSVTTSDTIAMDEAQPDVVSGGIDENATTEEDSSEESAATESAATTEEDSSKITSEVSPDAMPNEYYSETRQHELARASVDTTNSTPSEFSSPTSALGQSDTSDNNPAQSVDDSNETAKYDQLASSQLQSSQTLATALRQSRTTSSPRFQGSELEDRSVNNLEQSQAQLIAQLKGGKPVRGSISSSPQPVTRSPQTQQAIVGTQAKAKLTTGIGWSGEVKAPDRSILIKLSEPLLAADNKTEIIPAGSSIVTRVDRATASGLLELSAVSVVIEQNGMKVNLAMPEDAVRNRAIKILAKNGSTLQAQSSQQTTGRGNLGMVMISGASKLAGIVNQADYSSTFSDDGFSSTTTRGNRNYLAGFGQGAANEILRQQREKYQQQRRSDQSQPEVFSFGQNTEVLVYVDQSFNLE